MENKPAIADKIHNTFFEDFQKFQEGCPNIPLDKEHGKKTNKFYFKYASLEGILKIVKPILHQCNFIYRWVCSDDGSVTCLLVHISGEVNSSTVKIEGAKDAKTLGANITYARRYSLTSLLGIVAEEDKDAPNSRPKSKPELTAKAFEQAKVRIANGDQNVTKQCLLHFDLTEKQNDELVNLELEHSA